MTERDVIALGILPAIYVEYFAGLREQEAGPQDENWREGLAMDAYMMADAMLVMKSAKVGSEPPLVFGDMPKFPSIRGY